MCDFLSSESIYHCKTIHAIANGEIQTKQIYNLFEYQMFQKVISGFITDHTTYT